MILHWSAPSIRDVVGEVVLALVPLKPDPLLQMEHRVVVTVAEATAVTAAVI